ncbi:MAG: M20 family metallopeptidase [Acidobacteria bacterium]|nr:M20 family metallopeptidase [Acidobacteriota bacterium]
MTPVLETLAELIRVNSINPAYPNGRPESEINAWIGGFFHEAGIKTYLQEAMPGRPNLVAVLPGRNPERRIVFEAHVDTASIDGMAIPPFEPRVEGGRMYGRGSCDTKAGLAAMMHALVELREARITPPCEVWVVAAADEEFSFRGVLKLCEGLIAHAAVVAEPTSNRLVIAHKGVLRWKIRTHGRAAHSSKPHLGINAISLMARVVDAIEKSAAELEARAHPLVGSPTVNVGVIRGGVQVNFVPDGCEIEIDRRLIPGERPDAVLAEYQAMLDGLGLRLDAASMDEPMLVSGPLETAADSDVAHLGAQVLRDIGLDPEPCGVPYGSDASKLAAHGVPSVLLGPGSIDQAHAAVEWVECEQVEQAVRFYRGMMERFE